jgi:hypothetical protein
MDDEWSRMEKGAQDPSPFLIGYAIVVTIVSIKAMNKIDEGISLI